MSAGSPNKTKNGTRLRSPLKSISRNVNRTLRERRRAEELDRLVQLQIECTALAERCETNEGKAFKAEIASTRNELRGRVMEEFRDVMEKRHRRLAVQVFNQPATASLADVEKPEMLDRRFKETLELLDKLDFLGSSELQELHRLKNVRNLTGAAPRVRKNNDGTVKPSNQVPTAGPAVSESVNMSSLDRRVKQLQDQVTQLKLESAKQNAKGSSKNIKEVALRKWKGKAKALSTTPDQTSTAGPAALRKGKGKVGILSPIQDHIPTAGPVALTKGKGKAKDLSTAQDQTSIAGLAAQKRANAKAKALSRLQDQISFAGPVPSRSATKADAETIKYLKPLLAVAKGRLDDEPICSFNNWATKLDERYDFVKLAEGSFGEVFRMVQKSNGAIIPGLDDTVFKLIRLRSQKGIGSRSGVPISEAVSEIEVLTKLTEVPGFTQFREAYITQGTYPPQLVKARASYKRKPKTSTGALPGPDKARATQLWVVIEMQYAGTCLSRLKVSSHWHQWDVFWGVAIALARAEQFARFEVS